MATLPLSVLAPLTITDAVLISSTAPETDAPVWVVGGTYALNDEVISPVTHRIYQSQEAGNVGHDPTVAANRTGTTIWWVDMGPTNQRAMFDGVVNTQTIVASPLTVVLRPGFFNGIYLANVDAETIDVVVRDSPGGNVIYSFSGDLEGSTPADYYEYFFDRFSPQTDFLATNIDPYNAAEITLTLASADGANVACGVMAVGDLRPLGATQYGATAEPKSYSYIATDDFGVTTIVRRPAVTNMTADAIVDLTEANTVLSTVQSLLDVPCVVVGIDLVNYAGLRVFGLISGKMTYDEPTEVTLSISVQGLI